MPEPAAGAQADRIFICYRRGDSAEITGRLYDRLTARYGKQRVFKDVFSINLGQDFDAVIRRALEATAVLLVVIGDRWELPRLADPKDSVRREIEQALASGVRTIPLFVRGARMPAASGLPETIEAFCRCNGMPLRDDPDFDHDCERLISSIDDGSQTLASLSVARVESLSRVESRSAPRVERRRAPAPPAPPDRGAMPLLPIAAAARAVDSKGWLLAFLLGAIVALAGGLAPSVLGVDATFGQALLSSGCACSIWGLLRATGGERWLPGGAPMACILALVGAMLCFPAFLL